MLPFGKDYFAACDLLLLARSPCPHALASHEGHTRANEESTMAWRPGPQPSGSGSCEYDERDPWTQRFISKTDDGEISLDVNVSLMNPSETTRGRESFLPHLCRCVPRACRHEKLTTVLCCVGGSGRACCMFERTKFDMNEPRIFMYIATQPPLYHDDTFQRNTV